jgi:hypothetical protein
MVKHNSKKSTTIIILKQSKYIGLVKATHAKLLVELDLSTHGEMLRLSPTMRGGLKKGLHGAL